MAKTQEKNQIFKIIVCGDEGTGKTSLLSRYIHNSFKEDTRMTIGVQFHTKILMENGTRQHLSFWDFGGLSRFRFFQSSYIWGTRFVVIVASYINPNSLEHVTYWADMVRKNIMVPIPMILAITAKDLVDINSITNVDKRAAELVKDLDMMMFQPVSAKTGDNVQPLFETMIERLENRDIERNAIQNNLYNPAFILHD